MSAPVLVKRGPAPNHCSGCGEIGHNRRSCKVAVVKESLMVKGEVSMESAAGILERLRPILDAARRNGAASVALSCYIQGALDYSVKSSGG